MNSTEFSTFAMALKTYYPRENLLPNSQAMQLWYKQLEDIPYKVAETALNKWVATEKWSPTIADIRTACLSVTCGDYPSPGEAWEEVWYAIRTYGNNRACEAVEKLTPLTAKTVRQVGGFVGLCLSDNITADRARFLDMYKANVEMARKTDAISPKLSNTIKSLTEENKAMIGKR